MEKLKKYLEGKTHAKVAEAFGISPPYLSQILSGKRMPGRELIFRIDNATLGSVPPSSWGPASSSTDLSNRCEADQ